LKILYSSGIFIKINTSKKAYIKVEFKLIKLPNINIKSTPLAFQDARNYRVSSAKANSQLNLPEFISIETGIKEIISILEEGRIPRPGTNRFRNVTALNDLWGIKSD
jgi:hypothetical protein